MDCLSSSFVGAGGTSAVCGSQREQFDMNVSFGSFGYVEQYLDAEEFASNAKRDYCSLEQRFEWAFFKRVRVRSSWYLKGLLYSIRLVERGQVHCSTENYRKLLRCIDEMLRMEDWLDEMQRSPSGMFFFFYMGRF